MSVTGVCLTGVLCVLRRVCDRCVCNKYVGVQQVCVCEVYVCVAVVLYV